MYFIYLKMLIMARCGGGASYNSNSWDAKTGGIQGHH